MSDEEFLIQPDSTKGISTENHGELEMLGEPPEGANTTEQEPKKADENSDNRDPQFKLPQDDSIETENHGEPDPEEEETEAKSDDPDADQPSADPKPKKRNRVQERMDKLTKDKHDALRENAELKRQLAEARGESAPEEPQLEDFDDYDEYSKAHKKWAEAPEPEQIEIQSDREILIQTALNEIDNNAALWDEKPDDYDELMDKGEFDMNEDTLYAISEMKDAAAVTYYLAQNPDVAEELAKIRTETRRVNFLDKISTKVKGKSPVKPQRKRQIEPIDPVGGTTPPAKVDLNEASFTEFEREMNKRKRDPHGFNWG